MAIDKVVDSTVLDGYFDDIADAIRSKDGTENLYTPLEMPVAIARIPSGGGDDLLNNLMAATESSSELHFTYKNNTITRMYFSPFGNRDAYDKALTKVEMTSLTTGISRMFQNCEKLTDVNLPLLATIPDMSFTGCIALSTYNFTNTVTIGSSAFGSCFLLETVAGDMIEQIKAQAFADCKALRTFTAGSITTIASSAFLRCIALSLADFKPKANTTPTISSGVFKSCSALNALVLRGMFSLTSTDAFSSTPIESGTGYIYVPRDLIATYEAATNWSTYAGQFRALEDYTDDGTIDGEFIQPAA